MLATFLVNLSNYGLNLFVGRWLGPEGFAEANLIATLVMVLSFLAMGLQLTIAKLTAAGQLDIAIKLRRLILKYSIALVVLLCLFSGLIQQFLNFQRPFSFYILFLGIPFYFLMSIQRGFYQGQTAFKKLAYTYLLEMVTRASLTILLLVVAKGFHLSTEIVALGFLASFIITYSCNKVDLVADEKSMVSLRSIIPFLVIIAFYELSQIVINNSDVILVQHYFPGVEAGLYASMALLGRAVFFATWTVVTILFPKVIEKEKNGEPHQGLFWTALVIVAVVGLIMVVAAFWLGEEIMFYAFGAAYNEIAQYLWIYTLLTSLFACANVFVYYNMSLEKYIPVFISIVFGLLQVVLMMVYNESIVQILYVQLATMGTMLIAMCTYQILQSNLKFEREEKSMLSNYSILK